MWQRFYFFQICDKYTIRRTKRKEEGGAFRMAVWNPWHGCKKISAGCDNCYVYEKDAMYGKNASVIRRTANFDLPVKKNRRGEYKLLPQEEPVYVCMTSDFFLPEADEWRSEAWAMIKERQDLSFVIETKREHRFFKALPGDWGDGYENVTILCSVEIQRRADDRIPAFLKLPVRHKGILCEPLLEKLVLDAYLKTGEIAQVLCGGEQGADRACMRFCLGAGTDEPVRELRGCIPLFADRHFFPEREPDIPDRGGGTGRAGEAGRRGLHAITRGGMTG